MLPCGGAGLAPAFEGFDDEHAPVTTRACRTGVIGSDRLGSGDGRGDNEQLAGTVEMLLASRTGKQAIVADAVEALGKDVEQEAVDGLKARRAYIHVLSAVRT